MARPKKKREFRKIVVDQHSYQWRFNYGRSDGLLEILADDHSSARGQRLTVEWGWVDWFEPEYQSAPPFDPHIVTPRFVQMAIQFAVNAGWQPRAAGADFALTYKGNEFTVTEKAT